MFEGRGVFFRVEEKKPLLLATRYERRRYLQVWVKLLSKFIIDGCGVWWEREEGGGKEILT